MTRRASARAPLSSLALGLALGVALGLGSLACAGPDRRAGLYVEHPGLWGADLVAIHHATFSDKDANIRIRTLPLAEAGLLVANLEYPTSGPRNRDIEGILDEHAAFVLRYLADHPETRVTFAGFSQGGCVELDLILRIARREPDALDRAAAVLVAPARAVKFGRGTAVARRMVRRCKLAEAELEALITAAPEGPVARLFGERTVLAWSCNDGIVGHDSFSTLQTHIAPERVVYRRRFGHVPWASKLRGDDEPVYLATALIEAMAEGREPRDALAATVEFDASCE